MNVRGTLPKKVLERFTRDRLDFAIASIRSHYPLIELAAAVPEPEQAMVFGIPYVRTEVESAEGIGVVRHIYEGLLQSHDPSKRLYEFAPSFDEVPIEAHPNFETLKEKYGGYYDAAGNFRWPSEPVEKAKATGGFAKLSDGPSRVSGGSRENRIQGVDSFLRMGGVFRISYAVREAILPTSLFFKVGTVTTPPDTFRIPGIPAGRNWLKGPPTARWRGNAWDVTEEYILSGLGGWNTDVYDGTTEDGA